MSNTQGPAEHSVTVAGHRIKFWLRGENAPTELDEASLEHVEKLVKDDYREGQLCVADGDNEFYGWWQLDFS